VKYRQLKRLYVLSAYTSRICCSDNSITAQIFLVKSVFDGEVIKVEKQLHEFESFVQPDLLLVELARYDSCLETFTRREL
jgi:hypothetical protein